MFACIDQEIRESEADYNIKCSFIEIYNEQVMDLVPLCSYLVKQDQFEFVDSGGLEEGSLRGGRE